MSLSLRQDNNFNALRLLLASLVVLSHAPELHFGNRSQELLTMAFHTLSFGELAVDGFFLLSGFLIVQSWERQPNALAFFAKRALRILPAFIVVVVLCSFVLAPLVAAGPGFFSDFQIGPFLWSVLTLSPPVLPAVFPGAAYPYINGSLWTIRWEFCCYLAVIAVGLLSRTCFRQAWTALAVTVVTLWCLHRWSVAFPVLSSAPDTSHVLWRLSSFFLVGGCFYLYRDAIPMRDRWAAAALVALLVCMFSYSLSEPALLVFGGYLLFYVAQRPLAQLHRFNEGADVSYGIYLYAWPVQNLASYLFPSANVWLMLPAVYAVTFALATASWHGIEKPFLGLKPRSS